MEQVTFAELHAAYEAWLEQNVTSGNRKPNAIFIINGAKERAPAAALALQERLR